MFFGFIYFSKLSKVSKISLVIGSVIFVVSSSVFPWGIMMRTPIKVIQFPFRLSAFSSVLLSFVGGELFSRVLPKKKFDPRFYKIATVGVATVIMLGTWYSGVKQFISSPASTTDDNFIDGKVYAGDKERVYYWNLDQYNPKKAVEHLDDIFYHQATVAGKKVNLQKIKSIPDGLIYEDKTLKNQKVVILPIANYKNLHVYQGKKELLSSESKTGMIEVKNTNSAPITVRYRKSMADKLSIFVSLTTWIVLLLVVIIKNLSKVLRK